MNGKLNTIPAAVILVDAREAARRLAISPRTLWQLTKDHAMPSIKIGRCVRYRVVDLEEWTRKQVEQGV
ncbi:MAG: helix-turn-helix domain-containing protein [Tepidisphaeraceae bacterium]|jgi:excisionase family DNA binding protein